jgi:hypothetical protein
MGPFPAVWQSEPPFPLAGIVGHPSPLGNRLGERALTVPSCYNAATLFATPPKEFWYFAVLAIAVAILAIYYVLVGRHRT